MRCKKKWLYFPMMAYYQIAKNEDISPAGVRTQDSGFKDPRANLYTTRDGKQKFDSFCKKERGWSLYCYNLKPFQYIKHTLHRRNSTNSFLAAHN